MGLSPGGGGILVVGRLDRRTEDILSISVDSSVSCTSLLTNNACNHHGN